jgi:hypothetical protein
MTKKPVDYDPLEDALRAELEAKFSVLTPDEIEDARKLARERVEAKTHKAAIDEVIAAETRRLQTATGDGYKDEEIWITIDLPESGDRLTIDGEQFLHGHTFKRPRHIVNSMREQMARAWDHEADIKGESLRAKIGQYRAKHFGELDGSPTTRGAAHVSGASA